MVGLILRVALHEAAQEVLLAVVPAPMAVLDQALAFLAIDAVPLEDGAQLVADDGTDGLLSKALGPARDERVRVGRCPRLSLPTGDRNDAHEHGQQSNR